MPKELQQCGTRAAYQRHRNHGEAPCRACVKAQTTETREWRRANVPPKPREFQPCGTVAAYRRHRKHDETPCDSCKEAYATQKRQKSGAKPRTDLTAAECGTIFGYRRHIKFGEETCQSCKSAMTAYSQELRDAKKSTPKGRKISPCGTIGAYERHRYNAEPICDLCMAARKAYAAERRAHATQLRRAKRLALTVSVKCGSEGGYRLHLSDGTAPCEECKKAHKDFCRRQMLINERPVSAFTKKEAEKVWQGYLAFVSQGTTW